MAVFIVQTHTSSVWLIGGVPYIARSSTGRLWCCYKREIALVYQVCAAYSDDEGSTWTEEQVTFGAMHQTSESIAVDSLGYVHLMWRNSPRHSGSGGNILYCRRTAGWGAIENVTNFVEIIPMQEQYLPRLALDSGGNVHAVWQGYGWGLFPDRQTVRYRRRTSVGWQAHELVPELDLAGSNAGQWIAIDSADNVHVIWTGLGWGANPGERSIQHRQRTGVGWQAQEDVVNVADDQYAEGIALDSSDDVHAVFSGFGWGTWPAQRSIQYIKRTAGVWGGQEGVSNKNNEQRLSTIALDLDGDIHVLWIGKGYPTNPFRRNIQYRKRTAGGWQAQVAVTDRPDDQWSVKLLWANHPTVGGVKTNISLTGCAAVYAGTLPAYNQIEYWYPADLTWPSPIPPTPIVINKSYALAREEL